LGSIFSQNLIAILVGTAVFALVRSMLGKGIDATSSKSKLATYDDIDHAKVCKIINKTQV